MNYGVQKLTVEAEHAGQRIDNFLITLLKGVPKSHIYKILRSGQVRVNKKRVKALTRLQAGDQLRIPPIRLAEKGEINVSSSLEQCLNEAVLFENPRILIINKPAGLAVHGGSGQSLGLIEAMRQVRPDLKYLELVHRLDKDTSGCLVLSKRRSSLRQLHELFRQRTVKKVYSALLQGEIAQAELTVSAPLLKHVLQSGERMAKVSKQGKPATTVFKPQQVLAGYTLVKAYPESGRMHQIRVHAQHIGHPIAGDQKYGGPAGRRLFLHASELSFTLDEQEISVTAPLAPLLAEWLQSLENVGE